MLKCWYWNTSVQKYHNTYQKYIWKKKKGICKYKCRNTFCQGTNIHIHKKKPFWDVNYYITGKRLLFVRQKWINFGIFSYTVVTSVAFLNSSSISRFRFGQNVMLANEIKRTTSVNEHGFILKQTKTVYTLKKVLNRANIFFSRFLIYMNCSFGAGNRCFVDRVCTFKAKNESFSKNKNSD